MKDWVEKLKCKSVGHDWRYNFPSHPSKRICACCKLRQKFSGFNGLETIWFDGFKDERADEQLIKKWFE